MSGRKWGEIKSNETSTGNQKLSARWQGFIDNLVGFTFLWASVLKTTCHVPVGTCEGFGV